MKSEIERDRSQRTRYTDIPIGIRHLERTGRAKPASACSKLVWPGHGQCQTPTVLLGRAVDRQMAFAAQSRQEESLPKRNVYGCLRVVVVPLDAGKDVARKRQIRHPVSPSPDVARIQSDLRIPWSGKSGFGFILDIGQHASRKESAGMLKIEGESQRRSAVCLAQAVENVVRRQSDHTVQAIRAWLRERIQAHATGSWNRDQGKQPVFTTVRNGHRGKRPFRIIWRLSSLILPIGLVFCRGASAHHSPSIYDTSNEQLITGTVVSFEWVQPHTWTRLESTDSNGRTIIWALEGMNPDYLGRRGWTSSSLRKGDVIEVAFFPRKDGERYGMFIRATLDDGTQKVMAVTDR